MHGLNGDILVWNPVTKRRHELMSGGIRVTAETLRLQLEMAGQTDLPALPYHQAILQKRIPLSIGGGIGQSRTYMLLLKKAHLGEVTVSVWPKILKEICIRKTFVCWNDQLLSQVENQRGAWFFAWYIARKQIGPNPVSISITSELHQR